MDGDLPYYANTFERNVIANYAAQDKDTALVAEMKLGYVSEQVITLWNVIGPRLTRELILGRLSPEVPNSLKWSEVVLSVMASGLWARYLKRWMGRYKISSNLMERTRNYITVGSETAANELLGTELVYDI